MKNIFLTFVIDLFLNPITGSSVSNVQENTFLFSITIKYFIIY